MYVGGSNPLIGFMPIKDLTKKRAYDSAWQLRKKRSRKEKLVSLLGGECSRCGYNKCLGALEFHHINPSEKSFAISSGVGLNRPYNLLVEEIKKCELICSNCHKEQHYQLDVLRTG